MELIEVLILGNIMATFILFLIQIYLFAKLSLLQVIVKGLKNPEKLIKEILKTKIPVLRNSETGEFILPGQDEEELTNDGYKPPKGKNPITG